MFKRFLGWLLIIQYLNAYVLQAAPGDIKIIFSPEEQNSSKSVRPTLSKILSPSQGYDPLKPSVFSLKLLKETPAGIHEEIYNDSCKFENNYFQFSPQIFNGRSSDIKIENCKVENDHTLHLTSALAGYEFSIHFYRTGEAKLQKINCPLTHIELETFGKIETGKQPIKLRELSLTGTSIRTTGNLFVDYLNLTATDALGAITNEIEGRIVIGKEAHVWKGQFYNRGRVKGQDKSSLNLHGNNLTNQYMAQNGGTPFKTTIKWQGDFSILDIGHFFNESNVRPIGTHIDKEGRITRKKNNKEASLFIKARSIHNKSNILSDNYSFFTCSGDFLNEGRIKGAIQTFFNVGGSLTNRKEIQSHFFSFKILGSFKNKGGTVIGDCGEVSAKTMMNRGEIDSRLFSLQTSHLLNFSKIHIGKDGYIQERKGGKGLFNARGAQIISAGSLEIKGDSLINQGDSTSKGIIQANRLVTHLNQLINEGEIIANEKIDLNALCVTNTYSGVFRFPQNGEVSSYKVTNTENVLGDYLKIAANIFNNLGHIISSRDLTFEIKELFKNVKNALVSSIQDLVIKGVGKIENEGCIGSQGKVKADSTKIINTGQIISQQEVEINTKEDTKRKQNNKNLQDFENEGLILSPTIIIKVQSGSNTGSINDKIDLDKNDTLKGLIASKLIQLTIDETFENKGHIVGGNAIELVGNGTFANDGNINKTDRFTSHLKGFKNRGTIRAHQAISLDNLTQTLQNSGLMLSDGMLSVTSQSELLNDGFIEGRNGPVTIIAQKLVNNKLLSALQGLLTLNITQGENLNMILGQSVTLEIGEKFTNKRTMRALQNLNIKGKSELDNDGDIIVGNEFKAHLNTLKNYKLIKAQKAYLDVRNLENFHSILAKEGLSLRGEIGMNQGDMVSEGKIDVQVSHFTNSKFMGGKEGVFISNANIIHQGTNGQIQSKEGTVKLDANDVDVKGEVAGKNIEIQSNAKPFMDKVAKLIATETLTLKVPHGWDLSGANRDIGSHFSLTGPFLNPGNLRIGGNFTWNNSQSLTTDFDIIADGTLDFNINGPWVNNANIQGRSGSKIKAVSFNNAKGTFYSAINTVFELNEGFDNYHDIEVWGDFSINAKKGSITNHPDAQISQKNLSEIPTDSNSKPSNLVTLTAAENVKNHSAIFLMEGDVIVNSKTFFNEAANPAFEKAERKGRVQSKLRYEWTQHYHPATRAIPTYRKDGGEGALFEARNISILANKLENKGSKISARQNFLFQGKAVDNETRKFLETGTWYHYLGQAPGYMKHGKLTDTKRMYDRYGWESYNNKEYKPPFIAQIYAQGSMTLNLGGETINVEKGKPVPKHSHITDTGEIKAYDKLTITGNAKIEIGNGDDFKNINKISKTDFQFAALEKYFDESKLGGPSFWEVNTQTETGFKIVPNKPTHLLPTEEIKHQLRNLELMESLPHEQRTGIFKFWEPKVKDLNTFVNTLTSKSLNQMPPRIAVIGKPQGMERMHHHPSLLADLVTKCFLETIGFGSISKHIYSPGLLARVLEEQGYLDAIKANKHKALPAPENWENLTADAQRKGQLREETTHQKVKNFEHPAIVYQLREDFGERVFSALVTFPESIRKQFQKSVFGTIAANYLTIESKEIKNMGELDGNVTDIKTDILENYKRIEGNDVFIDVNRVICETPVIRELSIDGYRDHLQEEAVIRARTGNLEIKARQYIQSRGATFEAAKNVLLSSEGDSSLGAQALAAERSFSSKHSTYHSYALRHHKTKIKAGHNVDIIAGRSLVFEGLDIASGKNTHAKSYGTFVEKKVRDVFEEETQRKSKKKTFKKKKTKTVQKTSINTLSNNNNSNGNIHFESEEDMHLQSPHMKALGSIMLQSHHGKVFIEAANSFQAYCTQKKGKTALWRSERNKGSIYEQREMGKILAEGGLIILGDKGIEVQIKGSLDQLEKNPETAWVKTLRNNPNVKWHLILEEHKTWNYKSQGLTPGGAAIISLAMGIATGGTGATLSTIVGGGMLGAMTSASFQTLASQAAISLINNQGDPSKTLRDLGSKENLRCLAINVAAAGLIEKISDKLMLPVKPESIPDYAKVNAVRIGVSTGIAAVIEKKKDIMKSLEQGLKAVVGNTFGGYLAKQIGDFRGDLGYIPHKALHGVLGAAMGAILDSKPSRGAISGGLGGMLAEMVAEAITPSVQDLQQGILEEARLEGRTLTKREFEKTLMEELRPRANIAKLVSASLSLALKQDVDIAITTAANAVENNFLIHVAYYGVVGGLTLWTAYDLYNTYEQDGPEAALKKAGIEVAIAVGGGTLIKGVMKGGYTIAGIVYPTAEAAWIAYAAQNPTLYKVVQKFSSSASLAKDKVLNSTFVKKVKEMDTALEGQFVKLKEKVLANVENVQTFPGKNTINKLSLETGNGTPHLSQAPPLSKQAPRLSVAKNAKSMGGKAEVSPPKRTIPAQKPNIPVSNPVPKSTLGSQKATSQTPPKIKESKQEVVSPKTNTKSVVKDNNVSVDRQEISSSKLIEKNQNGRAGRQKKLKELSNDDKLSSAARGWIKQEQNAIKKGNRTSIRNPIGKELAHKRGYEAAKGYDFKHSQLQDIDLHKLQHKYDGFGRKNNTPREAQLKLNQSNSSIGGYDLKDIAKTD